MITVGKSYIGTVVETDDGELALDLPDDLIKVMKWKEGDTLRWEQAGTAWILSKVGDDEQQEAR